MSAKRAVEHMLALSEKSDDPINLIISSPGGHVESAVYCMIWLNSLNQKCAVLAAAGVPAPAP